MVNPKKSPRECPRVSSQGITRGVTIKKLIHSLEICLVVISKIFIAAQVSGSVQLTSAWSVETVSA